MPPSRTASGALGGADLRDISIHRGLNMRDVSVHSGRSGRSVHRDSPDPPDVESKPARDSPEPADVEGKPVPPTPPFEVETVNPVRGMPPAAAIRHYFRKMRGGMDVALPFPHWADAIVTTLGAWLGIAAVAGVDAALHDPPRSLHAPALLASFGASAVLVFGVIESKLSQPANFVLGQTLSAFVGVTVGHILASAPRWVAAATGVAAATLAMALTSTTHPPGGATALIGATHGAGVGLPAAGYSLVLAVFLGALAMLAVALLVNNAHPGRRYPSQWVGRWGLP